MNNKIIKEALIKANRMANEKAGTGLVYSVYEHNGEIGIEESTPGSWVEDRKYLHSFRSGAEKMNYSDDELDQLDKDFIRYELDEILSQIMIPENI